MNTSLPQFEPLNRIKTVEPLVNAIAVFILATMFLFWDASRAVYVLFSFAALGFVVKYRPRMPADHRYYSWPIFIYVTATCLSLLFNGMSDSGVNNVVSRHLLLLIAIPLVYVFYFSYDFKRNFWVKFVAGCLVMGGLALFDFSILGKVRAGGGHNEAAFGFTALAMTSIVIASYHRFCRSKFGIAVYFLAILMGVCAMILSGTRTSWLAGFVMLVIAMFFYLDRYSIARRLLFSLMLLSGVVIAGGSIPSVHKRVDSLIDNFTPYVKGAEQTQFNSLRYRVEAWKSGWQIGMENKLFGVGPGNVKRAIDDYAEQNPQVKPLERLSHLHNQFLQTFAMSGLIGLFSLLVLVFSHLWLFAKYLGKRYSPDVRSLALAGFLLLVVYMIKSIPGVPFYGKKYLMMYAFSSAAIWGAMLGALRESGLADNDFESEKQC